jgi:transcriptional accessory protein Tex/SPT6
VGQVRKRAREVRFLRRVVMLASKERKKNADQEGNYKTYHEYSRALNLVPPHAILALARGEREKILSLKAYILKSVLYIYIVALCRKYTRTLTF